MQRWLSLSIFCGLLWWGEAASFWPAKATAAEPTVSAKPAESKLAEPEHKQAELEQEYDNDAAFQQRLRKLANSEFVKLTTLGQTLGKRPVQLLTIGTGKVDEKPAWLILGSVQASDLAAGELTLQIVERLLAQATDEPGEARTQAERFLAELTLYVIPRPSPDASERFFAKPRQESSLNTRATDDDRDGETNEDPAEDLDGNGVITMMRVESPLGTWLPHPQDPRVMIEADPKKNERGRYLLYSEGIDNDQDERWNEDGPGGVDFNRNFTFKYPFFVAGAGPNQVSEAETRAVADFAFDHPNIGTVLSFSPQDNVHHPWKPNSGAENSKYKTTLLTKDAPFQDKLAETIRKSLDLKDAPPPGAEEGAFTPWAYFHYGRWSLSTRAWWVPQVSQEKLAKVRLERSTERPSEKNEKTEHTEKESSGDKPAEDSRGALELNALRWFEVEQLDGFAAWKPFDHPDFPDQKVEIGGFRPYVLQNPPRRLLTELANKHLAAWLRLQQLAPRLSLVNTKCELIEDSGLCRLTATVVNDGFLPTLSAQGAASELMHLVQIEVKLPAGIKPLHGHLRQQLPVLAGQGGNARRSWLLLAEEVQDIGPIEVRAYAPSVGSVQQSVKVTMPKRETPAK